MPEKESLRRRSALSAPLEANMPRGRAPGVVVCMPRAGGLRQAPGRGMESFLPTSRRLPLAPRARGRVNRWRYRSRCSAHGSQGRHKLPPSRHWPVKEQRRIVAIYRFQSGILAAVRAAGALRRASFRNAGQPNISLGEHCVVAVGQGGLAVSAHRVTMYSRSLFCSCARWEGISSCAWELGKARALLGEGWGDRRGGRRESGNIVYFVRPPLG